MGKNSSSVIKNLKHFVSCENLYKGVAAYFNIPFRNHGISTEEDGYI